MSGLCFCAEVVLAAGNRLTPVNLIACVTMLTLCCMRDGCVVFMLYSMCLNSSTFSTTSEIFSILYVLK